MALDVLHKTLLYAVALLLAKHSVGLKRRRILPKFYFVGYVRISWRHHTPWNVTLILNLGRVTQITLPNNKWLQSTLESKHTIKIKRCIVSPKGHLPPYSDFKMSLIWTSLSRVRNAERKGCCHNRQKENKLINEKFAWNEKQYFATQYEYTDYIIITRCLTTNSCCVWFILIKNRCNIASSVNFIFTVPCIVTLY